MVRSKAMESITRFGLGLVLSNSLIEAKVRVSSNVSMYQLLVYNRDVALIALCKLLVLKQATQRPCNQTNDA